MTTKLTINSTDIEATPGPSLFDYAEKENIQVPTSCFKQGKCRECLMEVVEGMECLSEPTPEEQHLGDNFRLSCRTRVVAETGTIRCHTMRRAAMRIQEEAISLPGVKKNQSLDPLVSRDGDRVLLDGDEIAKSSAPLLGLAMDLGTTTIVLQIKNQGIIQGALPLKLIHNSADPMIHISDHGRVHFHVANVPLLIGYLFPVIGARGNFQVLVDQPQLL